MKQKKWLLERAVLALLLLSLAGALMGCRESVEESISGQKNASRMAGGETVSSSSQPEEPIPSNTGKGTGIPGSYTVPDGWVTMEKYSTEEKVFYVEEGHEEDELPDNISIEVGKNRYHAEDHIKFRDAIVRQLTMQLNGADATLTGDGTFTEQEDVLYSFTISEEDVVTKQFYIVGDQRYCLIHLTSFTGAESAYEAAQAMADSFKWDTST